MNKEVDFDLQRTHEYFAKSTNGRTWALLLQENRSPEEQFEMVYAANASLYHWAQIGTELQLQRGEWLIAHVYTVLGYPEAALRHAMRCEELTQANLEMMKDFDIAYAYEGMARALALAGKQEEAESFYQQAKDAGSAISDKEDKDIFLKDFIAGEWFGLV